MSPSGCRERNPFYPGRDEDEGNRFWELMGTHPFEVSLVNTGRVGGSDDDPRSKKLEIRLGAIVKAIAEERSTWERDPDFGYEVASAVPGSTTRAPPTAPVRGGRASRGVPSLGRAPEGERAAFLAGFPGLRREIPAAVSLADPLAPQAGHPVRGYRVGETPSG